MRKLLTIVFFFLIIFIVFSQLILPPWLERTVQTRLMEATQASSVDASLHSAPGAMLLLGQVGHVALSAKDPLIGQVRLDEVTAEGDNVRFDPMLLLSDHVLQLKSADSLVFRGVLTEKNLKVLLQEKAGQVNDIDVKITPKSITATGQLKIWGRTADVDLEGKVLEQDGGIYFHMEKLEIRNAFFGKASIGDFLGDILLTKLEFLPLSAEIDQVSQEDGKVIITASVPKH